MYTILWQFLLGTKETFHGNTKKDQKLQKRCVHNVLAGFAGHPKDTPRETNHMNKTQKRCVHSDLADFDGHAGDTTREANKAEKAQRHCVHNDLAQFAGRLHSRRP